MNKRSDLLDEIKNYLCNEKELKREILRGISKDYLNKMLRILADYYKISDLETGNAHGKIFEVLYINTSNLKYDDIATQFSIHIYSLDRYRVKYNKLALKLIKSNMIK